jgi:hypothetical protein
VAVLVPVVALLISSNVSTNQLVSAILPQSKDVEAGGALYTYDFCDGCHFGQIDCQAGRDYRGSQSSSKYFIRRASNVDNLLPYCGSTLAGLFN